MLALAERENSVVIVVDIQPSFMLGIYQADRVLQRTKFLCEAAGILNVPVVATEQYPERMGHTDSNLTTLISEGCHAKMVFSCLGSEVVNQFCSRKQVHLVGIETHICVTQTALLLAKMGNEVFVHADAVSARTEDRHLIGLERMRSAGVGIVHSESVVYEWMKTAEHERFRDVLKLVKEFAT